MKQLEGHVFLDFLPKTRGKQKSLAQGGGSASMHRSALSRRRNQSPAVNSSHPHGRMAGGDSDHLNLYAPLCSVLTIQSHHSHRASGSAWTRTPPGCASPSAQGPWRSSPWKRPAGSSTTASLLLCLSAAQGHPSQARLKWEHTVSAKFQFSRAYVPICLLNVINVGSFGGRV